MQNAASNQNVDTEFYFDQEINFELNCHLIF